jgi:serralysin
LLVQQADGGADELTMQSFCPNQRAFRAGLAFAGFAFTGLGFSLGITTASGPAFAAKPLAAKASVARSIATRPPRTQKPNAVLVVPPATTATVATTTTAKTAITTKLTTTTTTTLPTDYPAAAPGPGLVWSDEFNQLSIASTENPEGLWRANNAWHNLASPGFKDYAGNSWNVNPNSPGMQPFTPFSIVDGAVRIRAFRTPSALSETIRTEMDKDERTVGKPIPPWSGGVLLLNQEVKTVRYGYIEIRSRLPQQGRGMFPALWLYAKTGDERAVEFDVPREKQAAEIDLFEGFGVPNQWATTLHRKARDESGPSNKLGSRNEDTTRWHTYGLDWKPNGMQLYRDGVKLYDVAPDVAAFFDVDMVIRLNYAMDGSWFQQKSDATTPELAMDIDYVRVYRTKPQ